MDLNAVIMAVQLSAPAMSEASANAYGKIIYHQSIQLSQDPLITIAIIKHESKWNTGIISNDYKDFGLMQIRAKYYNGPAVNLLNPWINITVGSYWIKSSFEFCQKQLGREPLTEEYLSCYAGSCGNKNKWCRPTKISKEMTQYAKCLKEHLTFSMSLYNCTAIYGTNI